MVVHSLLIKNGEHETSKIFLEALDFSRDTAICVREIFSLTVQCDTGAVLSASREQCSENQRMAPSGNDLNQMYKLP